MRALLRKFVSVLLPLAWVLAACQGLSPQSRPASGQLLSVVATHSILGDLVQNVAGDQIELSVLVAAGGDAHTFQPSPADAAAIAEADLIFENGWGFEAWLDDLFASSASHATRVAVTGGLQPLPAAGDDAHGENDPHVWHSVANTIQMVENIRSALVRADPDNAAAYQANAELYLAELHRLDAWVFEQVETLPAARRKLVTTHDTLGYFAARYGFEVLGTILPASTEAAAPSARELAALVDAIKAAGVPAVFAENISSNSLLNQLAREAGVQVISVLYTDALGPPGSDGDTYLKLMRHNVTAIITALAA